MKTLEEIVAKWNGKRTINACSITRVSPKMVYVALNVNDEGNLMYHCAQTPEFAIEQLNRLQNVTDSCAYHVDYILARYPDIIELNIIKEEKFSKFNEQRILSHIQVKGYGIYKPKHIDIDEDGFVYTLYESTVNKTIMHNSKVLPKEVVIKSDKNSVPSEVWIEVED